MLFSNISEDDLAYYEWYLENAIVSMATVLDSFDDLHDLTAGIVEV